jgi:hypothetical protein
MLKIIYLHKNMSYCMNPPLFWMKDEFMLIYVNYYINICLFH